MDEGKKLLKHDFLSERRIEFIGNSITCGYGVEGNNPNAHFAPETENASLFYAALIGRSLGADYAMISYSGKGVVRNYGDKNQTSRDPMPSLYNRMCFYDSTITWDYSKWIPQVVVINLGTNDFSTKPFPDKLVFQDTYINLIEHIQFQYPAVTIFCVSGPMIADPCGTYINEVVTQFQQIGTNKNVHYIKVNNQIMNLSDWGSDWHPNISGHQKMADVALPVIKEKMHW